MKCSLCDHYENFLRTSLFKKCRKTAWFTEVSENQEQIQSELQKFYRKNHFPPCKMESQLKKQSGVHSFIHHHHRAAVRN